jgi:DNA modification methylase
VSVQILNGDCRELLQALPDACVHCVVTSPPYFGLRDYGVDGQIGLEDTPDAFVAELVAVFREVRRVLRDDGTLWLNLGDSYAGSWGAQGHRITESDDPSWHSSQIKNHPKRASKTGSIKQPGIKAKDLIGIPWRVAFALQADGWYLRQDIVWSKPNPMPESVTDRCTKAHEYLFLLTKSPRYHFDAAAIAEPVAEASIARLSQDVEAQNGSARVSGKTNGTMKAVGRPQARRAAELAREKGLTQAHIDAIRSSGIADVGKALVTTAGAGRNTDEVKRLAAEAKEALGGYYREFLMGGTRNKRSVWTVATMPFKEAHFATFPPELVEPCILAGCPAGGTVLDPFGGAGTTGLVADRLQRNAILLELNPDYAAMAERRIVGDAPLFAGSAA